MSDEMLTAVQLAKQWQKSSWTIGRMARDREIVGAKKIGRDWRFPHDVEYGEYLPTAGLPVAGPPARAMAYGKAHVAQLLAAGRRARKVR